MNGIKYCKCSIFLLVLFFGNLHFLSAQQWITELHSKLPSSDQKKLQKADLLYSKGTKLEEESAQNQSNERKSQLKHLEAAAAFEESNGDRYKIYNNHIRDFWKKYTGEKKSLDFALKIENAAVDSFKKARDYRSSAEKERKLPERIVWLKKAENTEKHSILKLQKVLFTYMNWPVEYDHSWIVSAEPTDPVMIKAVSTASDTLTKSRKTVKTGNNDVSVTTAKLKSSDPDKMKDSTSVTGSFLKKLSDDSQGNDSSLYGRVNVKEDQIDQFNDFLKKKYSSQLENYVINFSEIDYTDIEALRKEWYKYQFGDTLGTSDVYASDQKTVSDSAGNQLISDTTRQLLADRTTINNSGTKDKIAGNEKAVTQKATNSMPSEQKVADNHPTAKNTSGKDTTKEIAAEKTDSGKNIADINQTQQKNNNGKSIDTPGKRNGKTTEKDMAPTEKAHKDIAARKDIPVNSENSTKTHEITGTETSSEGFVFRVQIAACRVSLDEKTLHGVYNGSENIIELNEDNWYKYAFGSYSTYKSARNAADQLNIPGSFVIAYLNGKRIRITPAIAYKKTKEMENASGLNPDLVMFRVQIAATKTSISSDYLKNMYSGPLTIDILKEDGWYKYSLMAGNSLQEAKKLLSQISVPGAFIVAYYNNAKIDLHTAVKLTKN